MHDASTGGRRLPAQQRISLGRALLLFVRPPELMVIAQVTLDLDLGMEHRLSRRTGSVDLDVEVPGDDG
jgi:hypothetical protein